MYSCDLIENIDQLEPVSNEYFLDRFTLIERLGSGSFGSVNKYYDKVENMDVAIKSGNINIDEIKIGCIATQLQVYTNSLNYYLGFMFIRDDTHNDTRNKYNKYDDNNVLLVMPVNEPNYGMNVTVNDLAFEFMIALYVAFRIGNFSLQDINNSNITYRKVNYSRLYKINDVNYIVNSEYIPVIIDYGIPTIYDTNIMDDYELNEIEMNIFQYTMTRLFKIPRNYCNGGMFKLLTYPPFNNFINDNIYYDGSSYKLFKPIYCFEIDQ